MLGWRVTVTNIPPNTAFLKSEKEVKECLLAAWETSLGGINWLTALVDAGKATWDRSDDNYSWRFIAEASTILPIITAERSKYQKMETLDDEQTATHIHFLNWSEKVQIWPLNIAKCLPGDRLTLDAWGHS